MKNDGVDKSIENLLHSHHQINVSEFKFGVNQNQKLGKGCECNKGQSYIHPHILLNQRTLFNNSKIENKVVKIEYIGVKDFKILWNHNFG